jgi:hypothetical protein
MKDPARNKAELLVAKAEWLAVKSDAEKRIAKIEAELRSPELEILAHTGAVFAAAGPGPSRTSGEVLTYTPGSAPFTAEGQGGQAARRGRDAA